MIGTFTAIIGCTPGAAWATTRYAELVDLGSALCHLRLRLGAGCKTHCETVRLYAAKCLKCGCSSMVEQKLPKLTTRVRFPSPAPMLRKLL
jgi:hypothetical protein